MLHTSPENSGGGTHGRGVQGPTSIWYLCFKLILLQKSPTEIWEEKKNIYTLLFGHWNIHLRKGLVHLSQDERRERHLTCKRQKQRVNTKPNHWLPNPRAVCSPIRGFYRGRASSKLLWKRRLGLKTEGTTLTSRLDHDTNTQAPSPRTAEPAHSHSVRPKPSGSDKPRRSHSCTKFSRTVLF